ncbi:MAG: amidase [Rhodobacteraceae bacterium]|nr:MAG: amidase [Paracoccaceae bacterium]
MREWLETSAADLGRGVESGAIDPRALTECFLDAIANHPDFERVYSRVTPARARAEAAAAAERAAAGLRRGPLDGVPMSLKDLFDTAGIETEAGSRLLKGRTPERDAPCVAALTQAGMVCLGKTHLSELAFSGLGVNPMTATPPNRFDPDRAPGGSSSGAAASVALGLAPMGLGSDTGGSVRVPAAWNGLVGLKTTFGLISTEGCVPLAPSLDTVGPLCRTVEDAALTLAALTGRPAADLAGASLARVALLVPEGAMVEDLDPAQAAAFETAVEALARAGARIDRAPVPEFAEAAEISRTLGAVVNTEGYGVWRETIEARPDLMFPPIRARFRSGAEFRADQAEAARIGFARLAKSYLARTAAWDAVIAPTVPSTPPAVAAVLADETLYVAENLRSLRNTRLGNLFGLSGLTLPTPAPFCGLMLLGRPFDEARLLRIGQAAESVVAG